jgi:hypothetical protein
MFDARSVVQALTRSHDILEEIPVSLVRGHTDEGSPSGGKPTQSNKLLTEVDQARPMRVFRRYWLPVAGSEYAATRLKKARVPGEDLILFRDRGGPPVLLYPGCMHRGTTLFYGKGRHAFVSDRSRGGTLLWRK